MKRLLRSLYFVVGACPKFSRFEAAVCEGDAQEGLAGGATEDIGVDPFFVLVVLLVDARFEGNEAAGFVLVEGGVDGAGLGDELMEFEWQDSLSKFGRQFYL